MILADLKEGDIFTATEDDLYIYLWSDDGYYDYIKGHTRFRVSDERDYATGSVFIEPLTTNGVLRGAWMLENLPVLIETSPKKWKRGRPCKAGELTVGSYFEVDEIELNKVNILSNPPQPFHFRGETERNLITGYDAEGVKWQFYSEQSVVYPLIKDTSLAPSSTPVDPPEVRWPGVALDRIDQLESLLADQVFAGGQDNKYARSLLVQREDRLEVEQKREEREARVRSYRP